jgi:hypothetical protein
MKVGTRVRFVGKDHDYSGTDSREGTQGSVRGNAYPNDQSLEPDVLYHPDNWAEPLVAITEVAQLEELKKPQGDR